MSGEAGWVEQLHERAAAALPAPVLEYLLAGARGSVTTAEAVGSWRRLRFLPRVLRDVTTVELAVEVLGRRWDVAWGIAPTTLQRAVHPDGELAMARAAARAGTVMVVSSNAGTDFAEIAATGVHWWLQVYLPQDRALAEPLLDRAVAAGASAVVLTVDTPVVGTKHHAGASVWDTVDAGLVRVNFDPGYDEWPGSDKARDLTPQDLAWLRERTGLPVVAKGVLRPDDARSCLDAGASAVWVSNHGGRQLDRTAATADCLPGVVAAAAGRGQVFVDGGLRDGADVLAAYGLGADAVFLGRLPLLALVAGESGVTEMHERLALELTEALRLAGAVTPVDAGGVVDRSSVGADTRSDLG